MMKTLIAHLVSFLLAPITAGIVIAIGISLADGSGFFWLGLFSGSFFCLYYLYLYWTTYLLLLSTAPEKFQLD